MQQTKRKQQRPVSAPPKSKQQQKPKEISPNPELRDKKTPKTLREESDVTDVDEQGTTTSGNVHSRLYNQAMLLDKRRKERMATATLSSSSNQPGGNQPRPYSGSKGFGYINKRESAISRSMNGDYRNFGERLYVEGIVAREQRKLRAESAQSEREAVEIAELRESPQISDLAQRMRLSESGTRSKSWQRLSTEGGGSATFNARRNRMMRVKQEMDIQEIKECSFKPKISSKSKALMKDRMMALKEHNIPYHDQLFHDAERRRLMQEEVANWFPDDHTFQPNNFTSLNRSLSPTRSSTFQSSASMNNNSSLRMSLDSKSQEKLVKRLTSRNRATEDKMKQIKDLESKVDLESGQELFKPRTGRAPQYERNRSSLPIGDYLYGLRFEFDDKKEFMMEQEMRKIEEDSRSKKANARSDSLMLNVMKRRFEAVFVYLNGSSHEGALDLQSINLEVLDDEVEADLVEMRSRLAENESGGHVSINKQTFVTEMIKTVKYGSRKHPRGYLFSTAHRSPAENDDHMNPPFKPKVNKRSLQLASSRRVEGIPVEAALMQSKTDAEMRKEQRRRELKKRELAECTFKPKLNITKMLPIPKTYDEDVDDDSLINTSSRRFQSAQPKYDTVSLSDTADHEAPFETKYDNRRNSSHNSRSTLRRTSELERLAFGDDADFEQLELELDLHADPVEMEQISYGKSLKSSKHRGSLREVVAQQTEELLRNTFASYTAKTD